MIRVAIVEDEIDNQKLFVDYLKRYEKERGVVFQTTVYQDGIDLVDEYLSQFQIILMDIKMKFLDGMATAKKIREKDQNVIIIFITNMAEYAIQGYDVDAKGFILKPVNYKLFSLQIEKACAEIDTRTDEYIEIHLPGGIRKLRLRDIFYMESCGHYLEIHLLKDMVSFYCTIKDMEKKLEGKNFFRCNSGIIVNLEHVEGVEDSMVLIHGNKLNISRSRKKMFLDTLTDFIGGTSRV